MKEIIFLSPHCDPQANLAEVDSGGQCVYELDLAANLSKMPDVKVTVYCRKSSLRPEISHVSKRFVIKRIKCGGENFIPKENIEPYLNEFINNVANDLKNTHIDIAHGHYWDGGKASILLKKHLNYNFPIVWTPHSLGAPKRLNFPGIKEELRYNFVPRILWENYTMLISDLIIVSSEDERQSVINDYQIDGNKIKIISPGISADVFKFEDKHESRKLFGLPLDNHIFVTLGRMDKRKGYHNSMRAFAEYKKLNHTPSNLVIFAGNHSNLTVEERVYLNDLHRLARRLGISDSVIFRESVSHDEVKYIFAATDAYLCLSENEPFGITILESMYMRVPVIATQNGGPRNIISHCDNGICLDPHNSVLAGNYMNQLVTYKDFKEKLIRNAFKLIRDSYTWTARSRQFLNAYSSLDRERNYSLQQRLLRKVRRYT